MEHNIRIITHLSDELIQGTLELSADTVRKQGLAGWRADVHPFSKLLSKRLAVHTCVRRHLST